MNPPGTPTSYTPQGIETQMGVNAVGTLLFTQCLLPVLKRTVALAGEGNVRVTWPSTIWVYPNAPPGGIEWGGEEGAPRIFGKDVVDYAHSKVGVLFLAREAARRWRADGIVSVVGCLCLSSLFLYIENLRGGVYGEGFHSKGQLGLLIGAWDSRLIQET